MYKFHLTPDMSSSCMQKIGLLAFLESCTFWVPFELTNTKMPNLTFYSQYFHHIYQLNHENVSFLQTYEQETLKALHHCC